MAVCFSDIFRCGSMRFGRVRRRSVSLTSTTCARRLGQLSTPDKDIVDRFFSVVCRCSAAILCVTVRSARKDVAVEVAAPRGREWALQPFGELACCTRIGIHKLKQRCKQLAPFHPRRASKFIGKQLVSVAMEDPPPRRAPSTGPPTTIASLLDRRRTLRVVLKWPHRRAGDSAPLEGCAMA